MLPLEANERCAWSVCTARHPQGLCVWSSLCDVWMDDLGGTVNVISAAR